LYLFRRSTAFEKSQTLPLTLSIVKGKWKVSRNVNLLLNYSASVVFSATCVLQLEKKIR
jgi:hypothetical protein